MLDINDAELIEELRNRFTRTRLALAELSASNDTLIAVNEKLSQSEALKSNFLSNIRNEINDPLSVIMGLADQICWGLEEGHPLSRMAETIHDEAQNLNFQLSNIIAAAELESGEAKALPEQVNVTSVFQSILDSFRTNLARKRLQVTLPDESHGPLFFVTDAEKLTLILANLLDNAVKFSNDEGRIEIRTLSEGETLGITVRDFGVGIAAHDHKRIFDRFLQLDSGSTRAHRGQGLGLSIVKAALDLMNGIIQVESAPGEGTAITVTLPQLELQHEVDIFAEDGNLFIFGATDEK